MCSCRWWQASNGGAITSEADALLLGDTDRAIARRRGLPGASPMLACRSTRTEGSRVGAPPASAMASEDIMVLMTMARPIVGDVTRLRGELRRPGGNCNERVAYDLG